MRAGKIITAVAGMIITIVAEDVLASRECPLCDCDVFQDSQCDYYDYLAVMSCFGQEPIDTCESADINCDGAIDEIDVDRILLLLDGATIQCCLCGSVVPAVSGRGLIATAALIVIAGIIAFAWPGRKGARQSGG